MDTEVVTLALPELPEQVGGDVESGAPRAVSLGWQVRLVGEHGGNALPQLAELACVGPVSAIQKGLRRARVEEARVDRSRRAKRVAAWGA